MFGTGLIYKLDHRSESGGFALTYRSDKEKKSLGLSGKGFKDGGQIELGKGLENFLNDAQSDRKHALPIVDITAEASVR